jgi:hypothetical protein
MLFFVLFVSFVVIKMCWEKDTNHLDGYSFQNHSCSIGYNINACWNPSNVIKIQ